MQSDLNERRKSIPFVFNRDDQIVRQGASALTEFFNLVKDLRNAHWRLKQSEKLVYETRYNKQFEKARAEYSSDSTSLFIINSNFSKLYPFISTKEGWLEYISLNVFNF